MDRSEPLVFFWENLGPYHVDRLERLAACRPPGSVRALQISRSSASYGWDAAGPAGFEITSLVRQGENPGIARLAWRLLRACLRVRRARFFFCQYQHPAVLLAALALRLLGRRVFTMLDSKFDDYPRRLRRELVKAVFLLPYRGAITASLRARDYLLFFGFRADRIALGYDTLSVERIAALAEAPPAPDGLPFAERDFIVVARLIPKKNVAMAIDAFARWLGQTAHPRDLRLCGSGPSEPALRAQVARLGLEARVHFHGFVQTAEVSRLLARSLCLLLPSFEEQFGLVVNEAQAVGLPVLVTSNAGACDMLIDPGLNGFTLDPHNPESCAALMLLLSEDEPRWRRFATAARDGRERGDCRHFVDGVLALAELAEPNGAAALAPPPPRRAGGPEAH